MSTERTVKKPFNNCTAKNPLTCRYHGSRFTPHPLAKQFKNIEDVFLALDENEMKPTYVVKKESDLLAKSQADARHREKSREVHQRITPNERYALHKYSDEYGSLRISTVLRNPEKDYRFADETGDQVKTQISVIDGIIEKHAVDVSDKTLWRGLKGLNDELSGVEAGKTVTFPTYLSTSEEPDVAATFSVREHPVVLRITAKKALPMGNLLFDGEREMLIGHGKSFTVESIDENVEFEIGSSSRPKNLKGATVITLTEN